jgi:hypothetical protein
MFNARHCRQSPTDVGRVGAGWCFTLNGISFSRSLSTVANEIAATKASPTLPRPGNNWSAVCSMRQTTVKFRIDSAVSGI